MSFCFKSSFCPHTILSWIALLSFLFRPSSAEKLEPIYFVDGDIYATSALLPSSKFGPQNAFRRQLSIDEKDNFAGPWVSEKYCDPDWKANNDKENKPKNCAIYIQKKYCTENGEYGSGWLSSYGNFEKYADEDGRSALACPQCGCKEAIWIDFWNSGEIVAMFSFRNRREERFNKNNPLEFRLFGADRCPVTTTATLITWTNLEENAGTDGSWDGVSSIGDFSAKNAFQRQTSSSYPAFLGGGLPKTIWYNLRQPTVIGKFSFRNRRESGHTANNPLDFEFVGSTNCASWTVIQSFSGVVWSGNDKEKIYDIENINLMKLYGFSCYGIRVKKISGSSAPCIQDIKMWESFKRIGRKPEFVNKIIIQDYKVTSDKWIANDMEMTFPVDSDNRQKKRCVGIEITKTSGEENVAIQNIKMWTNKRSNGEHRLVKKTQMLEMNDEKFNSKISIVSEKLDGVNADIKSIKSSLSVLHQCQIGRVGCGGEDNGGDCGGEDKDNGYQSKNVKKIVTFAVPFTSAPKVVMATTRLFMKSGGKHDWWGIYAYPDAITTTGFQARLLIEDVKLTHFYASWIACGQISV